ncbi:hypothetical protein JOM56_011663 [Amanita muscaria]
MDILTFHEAPVVSTSQNSSPEIKRSRGGQTNTTSVEDVDRASTSGGHPPGRTVSGPPLTASSAQQISHSNPPPGITVEPPPPNTMARPVHQQQPPVGFQPDENLLTSTFLPSHPLPRSTSAHSLSRSNHSSFSFDIQVGTSLYEYVQTLIINLVTTFYASREQSSSGQDGHYLSPNGSRPVSLPRVQSHPQPHESPVLPVLPRIVSQPTEWGTPAVRPLDLASEVYEEAPTSSGFQYQPDSSVSASQQPVVPPLMPKTSSLSSASSISSSQQPVVPPVKPNVGIYQGSQLTGNGGNGYHRNQGVDEEGEEDISFDSATKRNTQWNSRMYRR